MAFTGNYVCTSYRRQLFEGQHDFRVGGHTFKLALYDDNASFTHATTDYTATNEISGTGYSAGGITLTNINPAEGGRRGYTQFENPTISNATLSTYGGLIYNTTTGGGAGTTDAIIVLDFGRLITKTAQDFTVQMPTFDFMNALLRI
jgi:hypothetical protein